MAKMTPTQEAEYALDFNINPAYLSKQGQAEYDRVKNERAAGLPGQAQAEPSTRSSPEVRARILEMFKRANSKYAKPFEDRRLASVSLMGGNWEEYGQIVLQMAILDTLLSIEKLLTPTASQAPGS